MGVMENYLSDLNGPRLEWLQGVVERAYPNTGFFSVTYQGGTLRNVAALDQVTPVVGDVVHMLSHELMGVLIIGTTSAPGISQPAITTPTPVIVNASSFATYDQVSETWTPGVLNQAPGQVACFFYSAGVFGAPLPGSFLVRVEIELTTTAGGPAELIAHRNPFPTGFLDLVSGSPWLPAATPQGVPTWIPLPIGWGLDLISGIIAGIGISSSGQIGSYSGTGRIRLTQLPKTM